MSNDHRGIRRRPAQERSTLTVDAILEAAAELFCSIGYDRASTNRIAVRAGVSIGSLYQYFANKEAILAALLERHRREVHAVVEEALRELADPGVPVATGLEGLFRRLVDLHAEEPELTRVLSEEVPQLAHGGTEQDEVDHYAEAVSAIFAARPEVAVEDPQTAAVLITTTVDALTRWMVHSPPGTVDATAFIREAVRMVAGYLEGVRAL